MSDGLDDIRDTIRSRAAELGLKPAAVSRMATGKPDMFRKFVEEGAAPRADRLRLLCRALGLEFYVGQPRTEARLAFDVREQPLQGASQGPVESTDASIRPITTNAQRERAARRLRAVERSDALKDDGNSRAEADSVAAREAGVSASAVAGWRKRVRGLQPAARMEALFDASRSGRPSREWTTPGAEDLWQAWRTDMLCAAPPNTHAVYGRLKGVARAQGLNIPPYKAFIRRWKRELGDRHDASDQDHGSRVEDAWVGENGMASPPLDADRLGRASAAVEAILATAEITLDHDEKTRLVFAIYQLFDNQSDDAHAADAVRSIQQVA